MKARLLTLGVALAALVPTLAQVSVEVVLEQDKFLPAESLPAAVRIVNHSGRTLNLGAQPDWLTFAVEGRDGFVVEKHSEVPVLGGFKLESAEVATRRVDLAPHFALTRTGGYRIVATVRIPDWGGQVSSKAKPFDVIEGALVWERQFGMPLADGATNQPLEVRRYSLLQANYLKSQLRLYLRVSDEADGKVLKVFSLGPMVSFSDPRPQLDKQNNLHVVYQTGRVSCLYAMISPNGEILRRQTYEYVGSRPRLTADDAGNIFVTGGVRRASPDDLPVVTTSTSDASKPQK